MAKKKTTRRRKSFTLPIGIVAPLGISAWKAIGVYQSTNSFESAFRNYFAYYTGFTGNPAKTFEWEYMKYGLLPLGLGLIAHKLAGKLGLNRAIASAGVPIVRI